MFQIHYPFPHLYYYGRASIEALGKSAGFDLVHVERLRSFSLRGSFKRARMDLAAGVMGNLRHCASGVALMGLALLEPLFPADNALVIFRPQSS
jgi:hypothetical protein